MRKKKIKEFKDGKDYNYFVKKDMSSFSGQWVAIANKRVLANGKDLHKVIKKAEKKNKDIALAKIPFKNQILIL